MPEATARRPDTELEVGIACNNDCGRFAGEAHIVTVQRTDGSAIRLDGEARMELEERGLPQDGMGQDLRLFSPGEDFPSATFTASSMANMVGNVYWRSFKMPRREVVRLLEWLWIADWHLLQAPMPLIQQWRTGTIDARVLGAEHTRLRAGRDYRCPETIDLFGASDS